MTAAAEQGGTRRRTGEDGAADGGPGGARRLLPKKHDALTSLVLTVPVFLVYHLGILLIDLRNGVDLVSSATFALLGYSLWAYVGVTLGVAGGLVGAGFYLRGRSSVEPRALVPVLVESTVLAVLMMFSVGWAVQHLFAAQIGGQALGPFEKVVMAAGAGFHEELVFRVLLYAGLGAAAARAFARPRWQVMLVTALAASFVFSAIHYVGEMSDPFTLLSFVFRFLCGLYLTAVFHFRGFAVAVYTHALYDVMVFFLA